MSEPIEATISETIEGELLSVGGPVGMLDVGYHKYVRVDEIVAFYDGAYKGDMERFVVDPIVEWDAVSCVIVLRGGYTVPGYLKAATLRKRWEAAMGVGE